MAVPRLASAVLALLALAALTAAQSVVTVKTDGSGDFLTIQSAVDASSSGDIVLVFGGFSENVTIDKGLSLVAMPTAMISKAAAGPGASLPALRIAGLVAGETVVVSGFTIFVGEGGASSALEVTGPAGAVWLQDVFVDSYGAPAVRVDDGASVVVVSSLLQTNLIPALPDGTPQPGSGADVLGGSRIDGYDADLRGSHGTLQGGSNPVPTAAPDGGPGLVVSDAVARFTGGSIRGGSGNTFHSEGCTFGGDGGPGLVTLAGPLSDAPRVLLRGVDVAGGSGGFFTSACAPAPAPGPAFATLPGSTWTMAAAPRVLVLPAHAEMGEPIALQLQGVAGDLAFLLVATTPAPAFTIGQMDLHLDLDTLILLEAVPLVSGTLSLPVTIPVLPPGIEGFTLPLQALFADGTGAVHTGNPRALVIH